MKKLASYLMQTPHKLHVPILAIAALFGIAMCCSSAYAQSGAGSIQGTVSDATGAVLSGASIHVLQQGTNATFDTKSAAVGFFQVPDLFTGTYELTISAPGMKTYKTSIELLVAQNAVINASLAAGAVTQQVEVAASAVQLTTHDNGTISSTLENARINQLPMNGRSLLTLTGETTPGLDTCSEQSSAVCANGLLGEAVEFYADGVPLTNREWGGFHEGQNQMPDPDSVQEVRVETTGIGAEYATPVAGIITTKSGTNSLHGALFETARNNAFGIAKSRQNPSNYSAPHYVRNEFGASVGGPIVLPHVYHGKDKSFWFFDWARYSLASDTNDLISMPTLAMKQGDFSGLINSSGVLLQLYDPATTQASANCNGTGVSNPYCRAPFAKNQIPIGRLSPTAKVIYDILPAPSTAANPLVTSNLADVAPVNSQSQSFTFRLDHVFNENNRAYLRYTSHLTSETELGNAATEPATLAADGLPYGASGIVYKPDDMFAGALEFSHVFSPTFFSETIVSQQWWGEQNFAGGTPLTDFESKLGLPNNFGEPGFPNLQTIIGTLTGTQNIYGVIQIIQNVDENLTKTVGKHQMQFGFRYRHERFGLRPQESKDAINFGANATGLENPASGANYTDATNAGNANGDFFLGAASSYSVTHEPPLVHAHDMEFDGYFQDNFHMSRDLTLNLGLRYEAHPAPWTKYNLMVGFDLTNDALVLAAPQSQLIAEGYATQATITNDQNDGAKIETSQQAGMPANTLLRNNDFTIGPRVGFAYLPFGGKYGTVLRGAYGRYIYPVSTNDSLQSIFRDNPLLTSYSQSYTSAAQSPDGLPNYLLRNPQTVVMGANSSNVVNSSTTTSILPGITNYSMNPDSPPDYVTQMDVTIEQPLKGNSALRLSWVWSHGTNLDQAYDYNNSPGAYVWEMQTGTIPPTGGTAAIGTNQYSSTAIDPYDKITWGSGSSQAEKSGWSNDNALQATYQRLFHRGIAYQINYTWSKPFRVGGNLARDSVIYPTADYVGYTQGAANTSMTPAYGQVTAPALPPARPAGLAPYAFFHALNQFENHIVDTATPKQHIRFNGILDLPFGRGKRFLGNANRFLNEVVGGVQLAGDGNIFSQDFAITATNWGPTNPLQVYKHKAPITDCRSGNCYKEYEWFNGYLAPTVIPANSSNASCTLSAGLVTGLPSNWAPYQTPIDTDCVKTDAAFKYYGANEVNITLPGGTPTPIVYAPTPATSTTAGAVGSNPFAHTVLNGPINYTVDLSLFKVFPITEKVNLRFNLDAFNALNVQGYNNPSATDGTESIQPNGVSSSFNTPRQLQFTLRLTF